MPTPDITRAVLTRYLPPGDVPNLLHGPDASGFVAHHLEKIGRGECACRLNSYGYRCPEFSLRCERTILAVGGEDLLGCGLAPGETVTELLKGSLQHATGRSVGMFNLAVPGASNQCVARLVFQATARLQPDAVLLFFSDPRRREYFTVDGRWYQFVPGTLHRARELNEIRTHLQELAAEESFPLQLLTAHRAISACLRDTPWVCCLPDMPPVARRIILSQSDSSRTIIDQRTDDDIQAHHKRLAESCWQKLRLLLGL